jgi:pimeloyl-ACP methyl ester carboxylesterase
MADLPDLFPGYQSRRIDTKAGALFARIGGNGPPLLLLHGYPQTHVLWHSLAPLLHDRFTLVIADLPGYGQSDVPEANARHARDLSAFDPRALAHYDALFTDPKRIHATCEDYRAGTTTDSENDRKDREAGRKITCPVLALWGAAGIPSDSGPLPIWREWCDNVSGQPIDSGHFVPEENPSATAAALLEFLRE